MRCTHEPPTVTRCGFYDLESSTYIHSSRRLLQPFCSLPVIILLLLAVTADCTEYAGDSTEHNTNENEVQDEAEATHGCAHDHASSHAIAKAAETKRRESKRREPERAWSHHHSVVCNIRPANSSLMNCQSRTQGHNCLRHRGRGPYWLRAGGGADLARLKLDPPVRPPLRAASAASGVAVACIGPAPGQGV